MAKPTNRHGTENVESEGCAYDGVCGRASLWPETDCWKSNFALFASRLRRWRLVRFSCAGGAVCGRRRCHRRSTIGGKSHVDPLLPRKIRYVF